MKQYYFVLISFVLLLGSCKDSDIKNNNGNSVSVNNSDIEGEGMSDLEAINNMIVQNPDSPNGYYQKANYYFNNKEYDKALNEINRAIKIASDLPEVVLLKAEILFKKRNFNENLVWHYERVIELDSLKTTSYNRLAFMYLALPNYEKALNNINKSLKIDKFQSEPYFLKGFYYELLSDTANAITSYQTAIERDYSNENANMRLGLIFASRMNPIALQYYNSILSINPKSIEALRAKAIFYKDSKDFDNAIITFDKIIEVDSTFEVAYYDKGVTYMAKSEKLTQQIKKDSMINFAIESFDKALIMNPNYVTAYYNRGLCYEFLGYKNEAINNYEKALKLEPTYDHAAIALGRFK